VFQRILVPLDGSARAERALTVAARLARAGGGSLILLQVVDLPASSHTSVDDKDRVQVPISTNDPLAAEQARAEAYLATIRHLEVLKGINTEIKTLTGSAVPIIEEFANSGQVDLIVMCSRGNIGFKRWRSGSTALQLARHGQIPVLVLHQGGTQPNTPFPDRLRPLRSITAMVALDGSAFAEAAIEPAANLVEALASPVQGMLLLTRVVPLAEARTTSSTRERALEEAQAYLDEVVQAYTRLAKKHGVVLATSVALGRDVATTLIRAAEQGEEAGGKRLSGHCDLIAVTMHGRSGLERMALGSVTEHVLGATKLPLLVVHAVRRGLPPAVQGAALPQSPARNQDGLQAPEGVI
jgi:nucleotide-binding universal stress UspA family protein